MQGTDAFASPGFLSWRGCGSGARELRALMNDGETFMNWPSP